MKRDELLRSPSWWLADIQNDLYSVIYEYMKKNKLKKKDIADKLKVSKGYVTQILSGDFDHKISKLIDISIAFGKVPKVTYLDLEQFIKDDANDKLEEENRHVRPIQNILSINSNESFIVKEDTFKKIKELVSQEVSSDVSIESNKNTVSETRFSFHK